MLMHGYKFVSLLSVVSSPGNRQDRWYVPMCHTNALSWESCRAGHATLLLETTHHSSVLQTLHPGQSDWASCGTLWASQAPTRQAQKFCPRRYMDGDSQPNQSATQSRGTRVYLSERGRGQKSDSEEAKGRSQAGNLRGNCGPVGQKQLEENIQS